MELVYATIWNKFVIVVGENVSSPWLIHHSSERVATMGEAVKLAETYHRARWSSWKGAPAAA
jgi:hypothetical protein